MSTNNYTSTEDRDQEHGTDWTKDEVREELIWCDECQGYVKLPVGSCGHAPGVEKAQTIMAKIICSCGNPRCYALAIFGHPEPVYKLEIEPLSGGQGVKDKRALELKAIAAAQAAEEEALERGSVSWGN